MAALSPHAPTRPMEPVRPWRLRAFRKRLERNWDPRSECTITPVGRPRWATAISSALTAIRAFIRESIE